MADENKSMRRATRIYEALLRLYPRNHRREYGPLMAQLFRDQYRAAGRGVGGRPLGWWLRILADLFRSAFREQLTHHTNRMINMPPGKLSLILFAIAVGTAILIFVIPGIALVLVFGSALALLLRAAVEWKRPPHELVRSLAWGAAISLIFGLIFPQWAKLQFVVPGKLLVVPGAPPVKVSLALVLIPVIIIPVMLNAIPFVIKGAWRAHKMGHGKMGSGSRLTPIVRALR